MTNQIERTMNLLIKILIFIGISLNAPVFGQQKQGQFSNKFLLKKDTLFAVKKSADPKKLPICFLLAQRMVRSGGAVPIPVTCI